jgi:hypothetical protein
VTSKPDECCGDWVATTVTGIRRVCPVGAPTLLLIDMKGTREFRAPLAPDVGHLLAHEFHQDPTRYSLICGLVEEILGWVGGRATAVRLAGDGTGPLVGEVELELHGERRLICADQGEAVLLAWRQGLPIFVSAALVNAESEIENEDPAVHQFRTFLNRVTPDEFAV